MLAFRRAAGVAALARPSRCVDAVDEVDGEASHDGRIRPAAQRRPWPRFDAARACARGGPNCPGEAQSL
jgi:hypothetical protein